MDGISPIRFPNGDLPRISKTLFRNGSYTQFAMFQDEYKLIYKSAEANYEMYNIKEDPRERYNLLCGSILDDNISRFEKMKENIRIKLGEVLKDKNELIVYFWGFQQKEELNIEISINCPYYIFILENLQYKPRPRTMNPLNVSCTLLFNLSEGTESKLRVYFVDKLENIVVRTNRPVRFINTKQELTPECSHINAQVDNKEFIWVKTPELPNGKIYEEVVGFEYREVETKEYTTEPMREIYERIKDMGYF